MVVFGGLFFLLHSTDVFLVDIRPLGTKPSPEAMLTMTTMMIVRIIPAITVFLRFERILDIPMSPFLKR